MRDGEMCSGRQAERKKAASAVMRSEIRHRRKKERMRASNKSQDARKDDIIT